MGSGDAAVQTPPRPIGGVVIYKPQTQVGPGVASSSQAAPAWKPKFLLDGKPLPSTACVRLWEKGEGGRIAETLAEGLFLPNDVHAFEDGSEESVGRRLEWHAIAVTRGVQKTDEPNKPTETDQTVAKFSVWFRFGSVSVSFFKNRNFRFWFRCWIFSAETEPNRPNIYIFM